MSKLANRPIQYPVGTSVSIMAGVLEIKNSKTTINIVLNGVLVELNIEDRTCGFSINKKDKKVSKANLGTVVSLFKSAVKEMESPFTLTIITTGVGFKAMVVDNNMLLMWLGRSHLYCVKFAPNILVVAKDNRISITGDKKSVTALAAIIKTNRKWDPCMKKGVVIEGEFLINKEGKKKK